jgi:hypothetical protein
LAININCLWIPVGSTLSIPLLFTDFNKPTNNSLFVSIIRFSVLHLLKLHKNTDN